jgi:hypothetical protein
VITTDWEGRRALPVGEVKRETLRRGSARQGNEIIISDEK